MKFRNWPTIISLLSGFVVSIFTILNRYTIEKTLMILSVVMIIFFVIGLIIKKILNFAFEPSKKLIADIAELDESDEGIDSSKEETLLKQEKKNK